MSAPMPTRRALLAAALCLCATALAPAVAQADSAAWQLTLTPVPANFPPGGHGQYFAAATNVGGSPTTSTPSVLALTLPAGSTPVAYEVFNRDPSASEKPSCEIEGQTVTCKTTQSIHPGRLLLVNVTASISASAGALVATASVSGGGAASEAAASASAAVQSEPVPFDFLPGFSAPLNQADGTPTTLAGAHPYQQTIDFGFPTKNPGALITNDGHPRDITIDLPRGLLGNPAATPVLCSEAQFSIGGCPAASQVGLADVTTLVLKNVLVFTTALYNMVPPPGTPAQLATNVANAGIFAHFTTAVRSDSDYGVQASSHDVLAFPGQPIFNVQSQIWGDPSAEAHDSVRESCAGPGETCPPGETPLLTLPGDCPGHPFSFGVRADSWEEPAPPFQEREASYESADLSGNTPVLTTGCGELEFKPTIEAQASTDHADSPAGLEFDLHQPQQEPAPDPLSGRATAILKDATVTFPAGMAVNPSQAAGLDACAEAQIGFAEEVTAGEEAGALRFSKDPQSCPGASKIGTLEASSPLLVQRNEAHEVQRDGKGNPLPEPLHGSVYLANPFANPFGSLVALYLAVEDPKTGIVAKLAGEGRLDPNTGQITTRFEHNPELPIEDIHVHIFGGDRGALITPSECGTYAAQADLTPWSAPDPEGLHAHASGPFTIDKGADGGPCPTPEPWAPKLSAGTLQPVAGRYSPLTFKLTRSDGSERLARLEASLPPGLIAKLAGVGPCTDAEIATAISREKPNRGAEELADPSCPASSQVGSVDVAAGAGPTPFHTTGRAYLAGPYRGAPLSFVIITPAVAGPFDLGTVVVRAAVYLDPETAQARTVSDPVPQLIDGVPADVRSVSLRVDRPTFTLNPTSCDEKAFTGQAISALGHIAPLTDRFQVGGCKSLPYKPKLSARLFGPTHRGGHPSLRAVFTAKPGESNTARISFTLPHSEFIDQAHFRTICTRVQFAAKACPQGSIYGHMRAITPLLGYPLEGPIYLRSSSHELPDIVAALKGPPSQPIEFDLDGRVDSVHGGVRTIFATVPDAPVTKAIVTMQGAKKGLFQNSTNLCTGTNRATLLLDGQNGKAYDSRPVLKVSCSKKSKKHRHRRRG